MHAKDRAFIYTMHNGSLHCTHTIACKIVKNDQLRTKKAIRQMASARTPIVGDASWAKAEYEDMTLGVCLERE